MRAASGIEIEDARKTLPPAAHKAAALEREAQAFLSELDGYRTQLAEKLDRTPHDKAAILALVDQIKQKSLALFGASSAASQTIRSGR